MTASYSIISLLEPLPSCLLFFHSIFWSAFKTISCNLKKKLCHQNARKIMPHQYSDNLVGVSVNCEVEAKCLSVITV